MNTYIDVTYSGNTGKAIVKPQYQYNQGQQLRVYGIGKDVNVFMHYAMRGLTKPIVRFPNFEKDAWVSFIPNALLAQSSPIVAYVYITSANSAQTVYEIEIPIIKRPKPDGFEMEDDEIDDILHIISELREVAEDAKEVQATIDDLRAVLREAESLVNLSVLAVSLDADQEAYAKLSKDENNNQHIEFGMPAGKEGTPGKDATHSWNGTVLTVTSASGTSSADLKGDPGVQISDTEPTDPNVTVWVDPNGEADSAGITDEQLNQAVTSALNEAKESGLFDGKDGEPGPKGEKGVHVGSDEPKDPEVDVWFDTGSPSGGTDTTLSVSGKAADAKATGDALNSLSREIDELQDSLNAAEKEIVLVNQIGKIPGTFMDADEVYANGGTSPSWYATTGTVTLKNNEGVFHAGKQYSSIRPSVAYVPPLNLKAGHTIYFWAMIKTTSNRTAVDINGVYLAFATGSGEYEFVSGYVTCDTNRAETFQISDNAIDYGSEIRAMKAGFIDLTDCYGDYGVPTKQEMDALLAANGYWFDTLTVKAEVIDKSSVKYTEQTLTSEQKRQARKNIGVEPDWESFGVPVLYLNGSVNGMNKDNAVTLDYQYKDKTGTCTAKWQGSSSLSHPKKNYTVKFDEAFEAVEGWGVQNKYCLKANYIDFSHARNVVCAKLWGQIVKSRRTVPSMLANLINGGAVDGFPVIIIINGEFHGLYTFNIPKDGWMAGMGYGDSEAILCAEGKDSGLMTGEVVVGGDGSDFELEYVSDADNAAWVQTSFNTLINVLNASDGSDLDTTIAQHLDWDSAIDLLAFIQLIGGFDLKQKNYLMCTYDGVKWHMGAYDMDSTFGLWWTGEYFMSPADVWNGRISNLRAHKVYDLIVKYKLDEFKARYAELRAGVMSEANVGKVFDDFVALIPMVVRDEDARLWTHIPNTLGNNVHQVKDWYRLHCQVIDADVNALK